MDIALLAVAWLAPAWKNEAPPRPSERDQLLCDYLGYFVIWCSALARSSSSCQLLDALEVAAAAS